MQTRCLRWRRSTAAEAATITYPLASDFVNAYEQRGTHAVLVFPGGLRVPSDTEVNPPIPAELVNVVHQGQLGYQRVHVAGQPYLVLGGQVPQSAAQLYLFFSEQDIQHALDQCAPRSWADGSASRLWRR